MTNAEVAETLRSLLGSVSDSSAGDNVHVAKAALTAAAAELQPTEGSVTAAAESWGRASERWAHSRDLVSAAAADLPGTWKGTAASACLVALGGFTTAASGPARAAMDVTLALLRLETAMAEPRGRRTAEIETLRALQNQRPGEHDAVALRAALQRLIMIYEDADQASRAVASAIREITEDLGFASGRTGHKLTPFLRASGRIVAAPARVPGPGTRPANPKVGRLRKPAGPSPRVAAPAHPRSKPKPGTRPSRPPANGRVRPGRTPHRSTPVKRRAVPAYPRRRPNATTPPVSRTPRSASGVRAKVLAIARGYQGIPYVWGGTTPRGFDCSGLTQYVYRQVGVNLPRLAEQQRFAGRVVPHSAARPGDLVCMAHHVGIYVGNGMMLNAPHTGANVRTQRIWTNNYTVVRVLP